MNERNDPLPSHRLPGLSWGVMGAARIARKVIPAIREAGGEVIAVAASTVERARDLAGEFGVERTYETCMPLLEDPDVEAIYVPLANALHLECLLETADAGKPCLCEKPMVMSRSDARRVHEHFAGAGIPVLEAFMWRHHPQVEWVASRFVDGDLGRLQRIHAAFSFRLGRPDDYRWQASMGGGVLWDIGCYGVNAARRFFRDEPRATSFSAHWRPGDDGVDEAAAGWLDFGAGRFATVSCSFSSTFFQGLELVGTEGRAWIERPWLSVNIPARVVVEKSGEAHTETFEPVNAYRLMIEHFARIVREPGDSIWPAEDGFHQAFAMKGVLESARHEGEPWRYPVPQEAS